jgi:hypothetical protein
MEEQVMKLKAVLKGLERNVDTGKSTPDFFPFLMAAFAIVLTVPINSFSAPAPPNGWQTIKDPTGVCQMAVPSNWSTIPGTPGQVASPEHIMSVLLAGFKRNPAPMTEAEKHMFSVDRMIENNADRWFYATKPVTAQNLITYHVNVPISGHVCAAKLTVKIGHSEAELRMIAATVSAAK